MRIGNKLHLNFMIIIFIAAITGYFAITISKKTLQKTIGNNTLHLAISSMRDINEYVYNNILELTFFSKDLSLEEYCIASNSEFDNIKDVSNHINTIDTDWKSGKDTPFIQGILNNELSKRLAKHLESYKKKYGYDVFGEIYVTNKYGVIIAATNKTSDYFQADEDWYEKATAAKTFWVGDPEYDTSSHDINFGIVVDLYDTSGNFVGILKSLLNTINIRKRIELIISDSDYKSISPYLVDKNGRAIFSNISPELKKLGRDVKLEEYGDDMSFRKPVAEAIKGNNGFLLNKVGDKELLSVFSYSKPFSNFNGLVWSLIIDFETEEIFRPIFRLRNILIAIILASMSTVYLIGSFVARSISRPLTMLNNAIVDFGKGNLNTRVEFHSKDEIGQLSVVFNKMAADIKEKENRLQAHSQELDAKVRERTQELIIANEQLQKLSTAIEQSPTTVVIADTRGNIQYVNKRFCQLTGYNSEEAIGKNPRILKSGNTSPTVYKQLWDAITAGGEWQGEFCNKKKNGELYWELAHISPLRNSEGTITNFIAFKDNITDRKRMEAEQKILKEQLFRSQNLASLGQMAGGIAHHFNNLLMVIIGYASKMEPKFWKDDELHGYVQKILKSSGLAANLVKGLLAFSRKQPANPKRVNVNTIIEETKSLLLKLVRDNIIIKTVLNEKDCTVMADAGHLEQILMNLATNASDAMPEGGNLKIATDIFEMSDTFIKMHGYGKKGRYVLMSFSDTGVGMDENTKARIFEPFFTTKEVGKGTGLGLPSVYGTVKQCHGYIGIESAPGKGTTFKIYLPLIEPEASDENVKTESIQKGGAETILLAEDEKEVRKVVKTILETNGYKVIEAEDGERAVDEFLKNKDAIELIVSDVIMPKKSGKEAYEAIKKIKPDIKVLFASGYDSSIINMSDIHKSKYDFIEKPVSPEVLLTKVREMLDK